MACTSSLITTHCKFTVVGVIEDMVDITDNDHGFAYDSILTHRRFVDCNSSRRTGTEAHTLQLNSLRE